MSAYTQIFQRKKKHKSIIEKKKKKLLGIVATVAVE